MGWMAQEISTCVIFFPATAKHPRYRTASRFKRLCGAERFAFVLDPY